MPENLPKMPRSASPVARSGAGDISERELSRERYTLQTTPPARMQPAHPKKQLFSVPVNKFTAKSCRPSPNLARIRSCLEEIRGRNTPQPAKIGPKAVSLEDLTPTKRSKRERCDKELPVVRSPLHGVAEEQAAARIGRFMLVAAWRRRRDELRCLRKTLETQVSCSERLRIQVCALKSLLDSDNAKVRLAIRELERLKQLLRDKDIEKAVLEREKRALEDDVCAAEDRASEMSIGWRNARNELESVRASRALDDTRQLLSAEHEDRERCSRECSDLKVRVAMGAAETATLKAVVEELRDELARLDAQLRVTKEQLEWWPRPLTRMLGMARSWLRHPMSMPEAIFWTLIPARQGC
ncbi:hypothetical protein O3G_MSEX012528 [Manduca sexta]|uniref:Uncharacterized protein n=1 Tax=Manduca sexta TaxID=7130 RepID=A0A921ZPU9_MANSE|nr:hypothetical protein O3G_MSEX012528 [Manduca sexta]